MRITIFLFDGVTALDAVGAYDPLSRLPERGIVFASRDGAAVTTGDGLLRLEAAAAIGDVADTDLLLIPGGSTAGVRGCIGDAAVTGALRRLDVASTITASVCTGALILGATGALKGRRAATHWRARDHLAAFGATASGERVTVDGKYWTAAGVSAAIDLGLRLAGHIAGEAIGRAVELSMEYDPAPPYGTGRADAATPQLREMVETQLTN